MAKKILSNKTGAGVDSMSRDLRRLMSMAGVIQKQKAQKHFVKPSKKRHVQKTSALFRIKKQNIANKKKDSQF